jgi:hypothetical protein
VVKRAVIRKTPDSDSEVVGEIPFGKFVYITKDDCMIVNGKINVHFIRGKKKNTKTNNYVYGWMNIKAITNHIVKDYAGLFFTNNTGKNVPVADKYQGEAKRYILPGDKIAMVAKVGDWCLTSKGWSKFEWFTKCRDIFDNVALITLSYEIMKYAVTDYKTLVCKIKIGKYSDAKDYYEKVTEIERIVKFFRSTYYNVMFDAVPGEERLNDLNEELGIDQKWIDEKFRIKKEIKERRKRKL